MDGQTSVKEHGFGNVDNFDVNRYGKRVDMPCE